MKHVALVTCSRYPTLSESDQLLVDPLKKEGFVPHVVPWDKSGIDWSLFDLVVLRSCWDYPQKYSQFFDWLTGLDTKIFNPTPLVRWNAHKSYLFDLQKKGVSIIPTSILNKESVTNRSDVVIKPAVGNMSQNVNRSPKNMQTLMKKADYLIQPFMQEVLNEGEYRFIFISGKLTHTVLKTQKGIAIIEPRQTLARQASAMLATIKDDLLYARVDGIDHAGTFMLMELELIEPNLYFNLHPEAAGLFAQALKSYAR